MRHIVFCFAAIAAVACATTPSVEAPNPDPLGDAGPRRDGGFVDFATPDAPSDIGVSADGGAAFRDGGTDAGPRLATDRCTPSTVPGCAGGLRAVVTATCTERYTRCGLTLLSYPPYTRNVFDPISSCPLCGPPGPPRSLSITVDRYPGVIAGDEARRLYGVRLLNLGDTAFFPLTFMAPMVANPIVPSPPGDYALAVPFPVGAIDFPVGEGGAVGTYQGGAGMVYAKAWISGNTYRSFIHRSGLASPPASCGTGGNHEEWLYECQAELP